MEEIRRDVSNFKKEMNMNHCPKCDGWNISGPHYRKDPVLGDRLEYRCTRCGYVECEDCADKKLTDKKDSRSKVNRTRQATPIELAIRVASQEVIPTGQ